MKFSISYPTNGTTKSFNIDDDNKCRIFFEKRMGEEVEASLLGPQFKGYVFKIAGGFDKDGFAMKQGVFCNNRIRLLLSPGAKGYRAKRKGERKRRSVRGCYVGPDIKMLSLLLVKKGEKEIPGLTDTVANRRLGPKRAAGIRKLYGIEKVKDEKGVNLSSALLKKNVIRRTFKSKKNPEAPERRKSTKIQRLVTDVRVRRKRVVKDKKIKKWKRTITATQEYKKLYSAWIAEKKKHLLTEEAPHTDAPKKDAPKKDAPKKDAPKAETKKDAPKKDAPKPETKKEADKDAVVKNKIVKSVLQKK